MSISTQNLIESVGWSIIHSLWISAALYILLLLALSIFRQVDARGRYIMAYVSLSLMFLGFVAVFLSKVQWQTDAGLSGGEYLAFFGEAQPLAAAEDATGKLFQYLSFGYFAGILLQSIMLMVGYFRIYQIRHKGVYDVPASWAVAFQRIRENMRIRGEVTFRLSDKIASPLVAGYFKPMVLFPLALVNHLDIAQVEAILIHELSHIRRNDYLFNVLKSFVETVLFFNPFVWLTSRIIHAEREHACDDTVLAYTGDPVFYAQTLLQIAMASKSPEPQLALAATGRKKSELLNRIKHITNMKTKYINIRQQALVLVFAIVAAVSLAWVESESYAPEQTDYLEQSGISEEQEPNSFSAQMDSLYDDRRHNHVDTAKQFVTDEITIKRDSIGGKLHVALKNQAGEVKEYYVDKLSEVKELKMSGSRFMHLENLPVAVDKFTFRFVPKNGGDHFWSDSLLARISNKHALLFMTDSLLNDKVTKVKRISLSDSVGFTGSGSRLFEGLDNPNLLTLHFKGERVTYDSLRSRLDSIGGLGWITPQSPREIKIRDSLLARVEGFSIDSVFRGRGIVSAADFKGLTIARADSSGVFSGAKLIGYGLSEDEIALYNSEEYKALRRKFDTAVEALKQKKKIK